MIEKIKQIEEECKRIRSAHLKKQKHENVMQDWDQSQKRRNVARNKLETENEYINDRLHEIHCLCVEIGLASYEADRYGEKEVRNRTGSWQKYRRYPEG